MILDDLAQRELIQDSTDLAELTKRVASGPITVYCGFDPTADSLHIGNLVPLLLLRRFQLFGHRPIALAGGATGMIGDPSGKSSERSLLDENTLDNNVECVRGQLEAFLDFDGPDAAHLVNNRDWTQPVSMLEFLRDVGKHVTVNTMLAKESIKARVAGDQGISFTEFSYMLLQAFDFWWLHRHEGCELQVGGSDQWGNITAGIDLIRRRSEASVHGLTVPLITRSDGAKFGKSAGENIWLDPSRTSPYRMYQYFLSVSDADVARFLLQLTLLPVAEAKEIASHHEAEPQLRSGQKRLAREVTTLVHGVEAASGAIAASEVLFGGERPSAASLEAIAGDVPSSLFDGTSQPLLEILVAAGLAKSKSDARRGIEAGEFSLNGDKIADTEATIDTEDLLDGKVALLRRGKKRYHLLHRG